MAARWEVVGGCGKGGIMVRIGRETDSEQLPDRLAPGALVKQLELTKTGRLQYRLLEGDGPATGWVTVKLKDQDLLVKWEPTAAKAQLAHVPVAVGEAEPSQREKGDEHDAASSPRFLEPCIVSPMNDEEFAVLDQRLRQADYEDVDRALAEALWDGQTSSNRVGKIVTVLLDIIQEFAMRPDDAGQEAARRMILCLSGFSTSCSQDEMHVRRGTAGAPCVLILGFGGSHVDQIDRQGEFYHSMGFTTISTTRCITPSSMAKRQMMAVARELHSALTGGARLLLHLVSNGGFIFWVDLMKSWNRKESPLDSLPPLSECLRGIVLECAPSQAMDPETGEIVPTLGSPALKSVRKSPDMSQVDEAQEHVCVMIVVGNIGALCQRWAPDQNFATILNTQPAIMKILRGAVREQFGIGSYRSESVVAMETEWELLDLAIEPPLPRLFLYSKEDKLFPPERIEAYVRHTQQYHPTTAVATAKCAKSPHCELWDHEPEICKRATIGLLKRAELISISG